MIRLSYALRLARTKLRSKRGVLITSIVVASLLFAALIATVIVFTGMEKSANDFIKKAGNDRYLVLASPNIPYEEVYFSYPLSLEDVRAITAYETEYYQTLREKYEALDIEYDEAGEVSALIPDATAPTTLPEEQRVRPNWMSPVLSALNEVKFNAYAETATNKLKDLQEVGGAYRATGYYLAGKPSSLPQIPGLRLIQDGKENFGGSEMKSGDSTNYGYYTNAIYNGAYGFTDQKLLGRYLSAANNQTAKGVPVVVSAQEAAALFGNRHGIGKEPESAAEKLTWLEQVQSKLNGETYEVCYRNSTEQGMLEKIQRDYAEMTSNEGVEGYQKPSLIYEYPTEACGDIVVKEDTRNTLEKQVDAEMEETQKKLGTYIAPSHELVTFQIVGIKYAQPYTEYSENVEEYVKSLLVSQEGGSSTLDIPIQMYEALPDSMKIDDILEANSNPPGLLQSAASDDFMPRVLEFATVSDARAFLGETCAMYETNCDKKFHASPYGSNYLILDEIGKLFNRIASIAFPVVLGLATIIIWFTISRIMAENRKETAVYRAMGAKRGDVTAIYIVYVLLIALQITVVSIILGVAAAFAADYFYGSSLTDTAAAAFGIIGDAPKFSLISFESPLLLVIVGSIFAISLIASIQPLIRNTMRSPIRDIRDE